jgi:hypothetical protein
MGLEQELGQETDPVLDYFGSDLGLDLVLGQDLDPELDYHLELSWERHLEVSWERHLGRY